MQVNANCVHIVNIMTPCYSKQYLLNMTNQRNFFKTHKKCSPMVYVKQNEVCPKRGKRK